MIIIYNFYFLKEFLKELQLIYRVSVERKVILETLVHLALMNQRVFTYMSVRNRRN